MNENHLKCHCNSFGNSFESQGQRFFIPEAKPHYAPDRLIDVEHIKLELSVDLEAKILTGNCTTDFTVVAASVDKLNFDAIDLVVKAVFDSTGTELRYIQNEKQVQVILRKPLSHGEKSQVIMKYMVIEPRAGVYFIAPDQNHPKRPWQLWTQGQDQDNRYWIPCHDAPNEKSTTEMIVTVHERFTAISNGKLLGVQHDAKLKTKTFHWKQAIPHASYLITLCVGEFVEISAKWKNLKGEEVPVTYYTLAGREVETELAFGKTPKMLDFFSKKIGYDYPFEKYAQVVAWDFIYGGMENTSATTQTEYTLHPESIEKEYSSEPLVSHELAHQWFGDLLTCKEWAHAWLNEGFATYFEALWAEYEYGKDEALYALFENEKNYKDEDNRRYRRPIVTNVYLSPSDIFDRHLYEKGGRVLHMLRRYVGDEVWWKSIQNYVNRHHGKTVETVDLQRAFEDVSGYSLSWFFDQWIYKPGHPEIKASYEWDESQKMAKLSLSQKTKEDSTIFRLPIQFKMVGSDEEKVHAIEFTRAEDTFWFSSSEKPKFVSLNTENTILADWNFEPGREILVTQLQHDGDVMGRIFAARELGKDNSRQSVDALTKALSQERFWGVQVEIAESLGRVGSDRAFQALAKHVFEISHPKVRKAIVKALAFSGERATEIFEKGLKTDPSPLVQYECGIALGKTKSSGTFEKLVAALSKRDSWHDYYDRGILQGLAELKLDDRVFGVLSRYCLPAYSMFLRREAVEALSKYGISRPSLVLDALIELTRDSNHFVRLSAINGLVQIGDERGIAALKRVADLVVEPRTHRAAIVGQKIIREGKNSQDSIVKLQSDFDRLREDFRQLLGRVEKFEDRS